MLATARDPDRGDVDGPPWPLSRAEIEAFGRGALHPVAIEYLPDATHAGEYRWRAEFSRSEPQI